MTDATTLEPSPDVLVVGAGLAGLACAALLAQHGVQVLVAERHPDTSRHPKARLINTRSMEIYRALGVEGPVRTAGEAQGGFVIADTLSDDHQPWIPPADDHATSDLSPTTAYSCDQQRIEPILRQRAEELGATILFNTAVTDIASAADHVTARIDRQNGTSSIRARYLVAADGGRSGLRERLGIGWRGEPVPGTAVSALFTADLTAALRGRRTDALLSRRAGAFLFARGNPADRHWQLGTHLRPAWGPDDPVALRRHLAATAREATGLPDLDLTIDDVLTWTTGAYLADRYRHGRVLLVGDAAHTMPPYGGLGGNTGVQDAHNLAWKLAAVCRGDAGDDLLDTYQTERRPLGALTVAQALLRSRKTPGQPDPPHQIPTTTLTLGFRYPTGDHPTGDNLDPHDLIEDPTAPSGRPGTRAPHVALRDGNSTLDLLDPTGFTFIGTTTTPPPGAAHRTIRIEDVTPAHRARFDAVYHPGALIRPDGVIAAISRQDNRGTGYAR